MKYYIYNAISGLFVGGPLEQADATRIAANRPNQDVFQIDRVDPKTQRIDLATTTVRDWTQQELDDAEAEKQKRAARGPNAKQRVKQILSVPAIKNIKTLANAQSFIDGEVTDMPSAKIMMGKILYFSTNVARSLHPDDDDLHPVDE